MRTIRLLTVLTSLAAASASAQVINEIRIDALGTDDQEFIEISGTPDTTLSDVQLVVIGDGSAGSGVLEEVVDLDGLTFDANGLITIAEGPFVELDCASEPNLTLCRTLDFENNDNVTFLLVSGLVAVKGADLDVEDDGVIDIDPVEPWAAVIDRIAVIEFENPPPPAEEFHYGPPVVGPIDVMGVDKAPGHVYLCPAGWQVGPFDFAVGEDTPGAANPCEQVEADAGPMMPDAGQPPLVDAAPIDQDSGFPTIPVGSVTAVDQPGILCAATGSGARPWWPVLVALCAFGAFSRRRRRR